METHRLKNHILEPLNLWLVSCAGRREHLMKDKVEVCSPALFHDCPQEASKDRDQAWAWGAHRSRSKFP